MHLQCPVPSQCIRALSPPVDTFTCASTACTRDTLCQGAPSQQSIFYSHLLTFVRVGIALLGCSTVPTTTTTTTTTYRYMLRCSSIYSSVRPSPTVLIHLSVQSCSCMHCAHIVLDDHNYDSQDLTDRCLFPSLFIHASSSQSSQRRVHPSACGNLLIDSIFYWLQGFIDFPNS